jgi:ADP-dependent NAD(P)H-hydrate dehydratase / NAD(P)H-hydrate epimerase
MDSRILELNSVWWGVSLETLMENAGKAVAKECRGYHSIAVFCGRGNNGGDGLVAARYLLKRGAKVKVFALEGERTRLNQMNLDRLPKKVVQFINSATDFNLKGIELIVDALVGVGFKGEVKEPLKSIIEKINDSDASKLSIDVPSAGLMEADMVVSLHSAKVTGATVADIGIPLQAQSFCGPGDVIAAIPERRLTSHKGDFGRLLVLGGCREYTGTPSLVAQAALRAGVDLVTVSVPQYVADKMPFDPNLIVHPLKSRDYVSVADIRSALKMKFDAMVFGNGLGRKSAKAVEYLMRHIDRPLVLDADALSLAKKKWLNDKMVVTPHEGEFTKIFGKVKSREMDVFIRAKETGAVVALKGALDVVSDGKELRVNDTGNPYMTVGGTGDVLAGVIGGLLAQNQDRMLSACAGVFLTGLAGDIAAAEFGVSLVATDVICKIPQAICECQSLNED